MPVDSQIDGQFINNHAYDLGIQERLDMNRNSILYKSGGRVLGGQHAPRGTIKRTGVTSLDFIISICAKGTCGSVNQQREWQADVLGV